MESKLKTQTKRGLYWSAASNIASQGMRFVFGLVLARLLSPASGSSALCKPSRGGSR